MTSIDADLVAARQAVLRRKVQRALDNRHLKLTLMPTEQCNFRCTYCYEDFELGTMSRGVIDGVKALIDERAPTLQLLELRWFGGEPMVGFPVVREICGHAQDVASRLTGLRVTSSMTTNGYLLTPARLEELLRLGVRHYQISLDGHEEDHDRTRRRRDGAGTFGVIWRNLLAMREFDESFAVMVRLHITPSTLHQTHRLIDALNENFGDDERFRVFFKAITPLGGPNDGDIERGRPGWELAAKADLARRLRRREDGVTDPVVGGTYVCYAAEPNSLVVRSNGQIAKCTVAFGDPRNQVGQLHPDGTLTLDDERLRLWFAGLESLDAGTLHCPLPKLAPLPTPASIAQRVTITTKPRPAAAVA